MRTKRWLGPRAGAARGVWGYACGAVLRKAVGMGRSEGRVGGLWCANPREWVVWAACALQNLGNGPLCGAWRRKRVETGHFEGPEGPEAAHFEAFVPEGSAKRSSVEGLCFSLVKYGQMRGNEPEVCWKRPEGIPEARRKRAGSNSRAACGRAGAARKTMGPAARNALGARHPPRTAIMYAIDVGPVRTRLVQRTAPAH